MNEKISDIKQITLSRKDKILIIDEKNFSSINEILDKTAQKLDKDKIRLIELFPLSNFDKEAFELSKKLRQLSSLYDSLFLVKDRADIAKLACADGIVLDFKSIDITSAQKIISKENFFSFDITPQKENTKNQRIINNKEEQQSISTIEKICAFETHNYLNCFDFLQYENNLNLDDIFNTNEFCLQNKSFKEITKPIIKTERLI